MHIIIAGEGKLPYFLTKSFLGKGYNVTVITNNAAEAEDMARSHKATIIVGDASDPAVLREADAYYCDLIIAVTTRDEDNLVISQQAKLEFGISKTFALVNDPDNAVIFDKLGYKAFSPTEMISQLIEQSAQMEDIMQFLPINEGKILFTEFKLSDQSPILNTPLRELPRPDHTLIVSVIRDENVIIPGGDTRLEPGDRILVLSTPVNHTAIIRMITGKND